MSNLSTELTNFFDVEIRNEETMRREVGYPGSDEYDATHDHEDDQHVPQATLGSALDSWEQAPDDVRADWCESTEGPAAMADVELDLRSLVAFHGANYPLVDLLA